MTQRILNARIRPFRVAVLIGKNASRDEVLLALKFLSSIWGGRFCQLLAVEPGGDDPLTSFRLSQSRPDLVYGVGVDLDSWRTRANEVCQPRGICMLENKYVENLHDSIEQHITAEHVVYQLRRTPSAQGRQPRTLQIVDCDSRSPLRPFVAALFGMHPEKLGNAIPYEPTCFPETGSVSDLIALHTDVTKKDHNTWLDLASQGLSFRSTLVCAPLPPTIVLVNSLASDLALFWNLRHGTEFLLPSWLLLLPADALSDPDLPERLQEWLLVWGKLYRCNSCRVTSSSVPRSKLHEFASRLQNEVKGTMINRFSARAPTNRLPLVMPFESEQQLAVELSRRTLTFNPPRPKILDGVSNGSWIVEFTGDVRRGRAVKELCLPPFKSAFAVLNTPDPKVFRFSRLPQLADGVDGINVHCSSQQKYERIFLPTGDEVLDEVLREAGINPVADEKRACYRPVMRLFGGLHRTAEALSGQRGNVLQTLLNGPLNLGEIQAKAKLGKGKLTELSEPEVHRLILEHLDPVAKRTLRRRQRRMWTKLSPSTTAVKSLLEFWADQSIVARQWHVGPCPACMGSYWETDLDISMPVACPGCGSRLSLPSQVPIGYSLHRLVAHAIRQGIVPVVLAGRFLWNLTKNGFFWLPGVKYKWNNTDSDLDILACCDGHIVVAECKSLNETPSNADFWDDVLNQFAQTIKVGEACRASFAVLAAMAEDFPADFQQKVDQITPPTMRTLLLKRQDLELGHRLLPAEGKSPARRLSLDDLIVDPMPD